MSIEYMTNVWKHSPSKGSSLLLMLALADYSNDRGLCWASVDSLAKKTRTNRRTVQRKLRELEASGEIINAGESDHGTITYAVVMGGRQSVTPTDGGGIHDKEGAVFNTKGGGKRPPDPSLSTTPQVNPSIKAHAKKRKRSNNTPPAVELARRISHRYPPKKLHGMIDRTVGHSFGALLKWGRIVRKWIASGYNPTNYDGMMDVYRGGWIRSQQKASGLTPGIEALTRAHKNAGGAQ